MSQEEVSDKARAELGKKTFALLLKFIPGLNELLKNSAPENFHVEYHNTYGKAEITFEYLEQINVNEYEFNLILDDKSGDIWPSLSFEIKIDFETKEAFAHNRVMNYYWRAEFDDSLHGWPDENEIDMIYGLTISLVHWLEDEILPKKITLFPPMIKKNMTTYEQQIKDLGLREPLIDPIPEMIEIHKDFLELIDSADSAEKKSQLKELADQTENEILELISFEYLEETHHEENSELDEFFSEIHSILEDASLEDDQKIDQIIEIPNKNEEILKNLFDKGITKQLRENYLRTLGLKVGYFSLTIVVGNYRLVRSSWLNQFRLEKIK